MERRATPLEIGTQTGASATENAGAGNRGWESSADTFTEQQARELPYLIIIVGGRGPPNPATYAGVRNYLLTTHKPALLALFTCMGMGGRLC